MMLIRAQAKFLFLGSTIRHEHIGKCSAWARINIISSQIKALSVITFSPTDC